MKSSSQLKHEKQIAAKAAVALVDDGMVVGLGSGSTSEIAIRLLGERVAAGLQIRGVPTSEASRKLACELQIPLTDLATCPEIDITIDGADRFDDQLNLIKGGGGALLREKVVAAASSRVIIIADSSKRANPLGGFPIPVEVVTFGTRPMELKLAVMEMRPQLRMSSSGETPFVTDEGNYILDLDLPEVDHPESLAAVLDSMPGVMANGIFTGLATEVIMGCDDDVQTFLRESSH